MLPIILSGGTAASRGSELDRRYPENSFARIRVAPGERSILISQIHDLVGRLSVTAAENRLVWIEEADKLTIPAQNALLKLLEEPPHRTQFFLTLPNEHLLLTTIRSRCTVEHLGTSEVAAALPDQSGLAVLKKALALSPGDRVLAADSLGRKREEVLSWTADCLVVLTALLRKENNPNSVKILSKIAALLEETRADLAANVSVPLTMQHLFLSLPKVAGHPRS